MSFKYNSSATVLANIREKYRDARGARACKLSAFILDNFTDAEIRAAFGFSDGQLNSFKTRANNRRNKLNAVNAEAGE